MKFPTTLFLILLSGILAKWTPTVELIEVSGGHSPEDMYVDPKTGMIHFLYFKVLMEPYMHYMQVYPNLTIALTKDFSDDGLHYFVDAKFAGYNDGENLTILLNAKKKQPAYVSDLFYVDSHDGGKTWSQLATFPRNETAESHHRTTTTILWIEETGRLFVFYHIDEDKLAYVTRPKHSSIFSKEKIIYSQLLKQITPTVASTYTLSKNHQAIIHLFWLNIVQEKNVIYYMNSTNNGISWSEASQIGNETVESWSGVNVKANPSTLNKIVMTYATKRSNLPLRYQTSTTSGASWSNPANFTQGNSIYSSWNYKTTAMAICGNTTKPLMYSLTQLKANVLEYANWNLTTMRNLRPRHPFDGRTVSGVLISCVLSNYNDMTVTALVQADKEDSKRGFLIAQDKITLTEAWE